MHEILIEIMPQQNRFLRKNINKKALLIGLVTIISFFAFIYLNFTHSNLKIENKKAIAGKQWDCSKQRVNDTIVISPTKVLDDKNDVHLAYAQAYGLEKIYTSNLEFEEDSAQMTKELKLIHIKNNPLYHLKELKHSYPYVIPEMVDLLNEIAYRFKKELPEKKKDEFLFMVTSGLRTNETQLNLSKRNRNAAAVSAHLFGTTVDISYKDFYNVQKDTTMSDYDAVQAITRAMQSLREECRLITVRERKQACFHTTVVVCPPKAL